MGDTSHRKGVVAECQGRGGQDTGGRSQEKISECRSIWLAGRGCHSSGFEQSRYRGSGRRDCRGRRRTDLDDGDYDEDYADEYDVVVEPKLEFGQAAVAVDGRGGDRRQSAGLFQPHPVATVVILEIFEAAVDTTGKWHSSGLRGGDIPGRYREVGVLVPVVCPVDPATVPRLLHRVYQDLEVRVVSIPDHLQLLFFLGRQLTTSLKRFRM